MRYVVTGSARTTALAATVILWCATTVQAQLPTPNLTTVFPPGAKQGSTLSVTTGGGNLDDGAQLLFSHPGITAVVKKNAATEFNPTPDPTYNQFDVTVAADVPAGVYDARVVGQFGVSSPRAFVVGGLDEINDDGSNKTFATAKQIDVNTTVNGVADGSAVDFYKFTMKRGQRVLIDCAADRIDSRLNGTLTLFDAANKQLQRNRDSLGDDPILDFTAPADGDYVVGVNDFVYSGGGEYFYRLTIHDRPHIDFVMPPVGVAGSRVPYTIYGRNLPGGQPTDLKLGGATLQKMVVEISLPTAPGPGIAQRLSPSGLALDGASFSFKDSNSVRVGVATTARVVLENEPNNNPAESQLVVAPCEVAGSFYPRRDADWIQFDAKKGEVYWLDLMSHRLGANTDPYLTLQRVVKNDKGEETVSDIAQVDDPGDRNGRIGGQLDTSTDDPTYKFTVPETGRYRVMIRDQFGGAKSDPRSIYRLAIRRENPTFRLLALPQQVKVANANQILDFSPVIRKGGTTMVQVRAERRDSFQGEIKLSVAGLPEGVTCPDVFMGPTGTTAWLVFQAKADAANWSGPVTINGSATVDGAEVVQEARAASVVWGTGNKTQTPGKFRAARGLLVSVIDEVGPGVTVGDGSVVTTSKGGVVSLPLKLERRGLGGDVKFVATNVPAEIKPGDVTIKGDASEGKLEWTIANAKAQPGVYSFFLRADVKIKHTRNASAIRRAEAAQKAVDAAIAGLNEEVKKLTEQEKAAAADAKAKVAEQLKASQEKLKRATEAKKAADKRVADVKKANAPKDANIGLYSNPITVRVVASPLELTATLPAVTLKQGQKVELPVSIKRLYGFAEAVEVNFEPPKGVAGLAAAKISVAKEQAAGKLEVTAAANTPAGEHTVTLRAKATFNKVAVETVHQIPIRVEPAQ